jgi:hypothetical protein
MTAYGTWLRCKCRPGSSAAGGKTAVPGGGRLRNLQPMTQKRIQPRSAASRRVWRWSHCVCRNFANRRVGRVASCVCFHRSSPANVFILRAIDGSGREDPVRREEQVRFARDSPLERGGFEPSVPRSRRCSPRLETAVLRNSAKFPYLVKPLSGSAWTRASG